jgi:hypothetical protein
VELFLHQQGLDTTSPAGRAMFGSEAGVAAELVESRPLSKMQLSAEG